MIGRNSFAIFSFIIIFSAALQTAGLDVFAFIIISLAISKSQSSSTYIWQLPTPVSITGTVAFFTTVCISPAPPLGIKTSIYSFNFIISNAVSLLVSSTNWTENSGNPASFIALANIFTIALLEFIASLPPLSITAFPVFKHSPAASHVTFGLASYIIPITPIATLCFPIWRPLGLFHISITSPIGSSKAISSLNPLAISSILDSFSDNLSNIALDVPFWTALSKSSLFAFIISFVLLIKAFAIDSNALFFSVVDAIPKSYDASLALLPNS